MTNPIKHRAALEVAKLFNGRRQSRNGAGKKLSAAIKAPKMKPIDNIRLAGDMQTAFKTKDTLYSECMDCHANYLPPHETQQNYLTVFAASL